MDNVMAFRQGIHRLSFWWLPLVVITLTNTIVAQSGSQLNWLTRKDGLAALEYNFYMHRSRQGLMYIGSNEGLNIYDGIEITNYREGQYDWLDYVGVSNQSDFFETLSGDVWYGNDRSLMCHNGENGHFRSYRIDTSIENSIYRVFALEQNRWLWLIFNNQIYRIDLEEPLTINGAQPFAPVSFEFGTVRRDTAGRIREVWGGFWMKPGALYLKINEDNQLVTIDTLYSFDNLDTVPGLQKWEVDNDQNIYAVSRDALVIFPHDQRSPYSVPFPEGFREPIGLDWRNDTTLWLMDATGLAGCTSSGCRMITAEELGFEPGNIGGNGLFLDIDQPGHREILWMDRPGKGVGYINLIQNRIDNLLPEALKNDFCDVHKLLIDTEGDILYRCGDEWRKLSRKTPEKIEKIKSQEVPLEELFIDAQVREVMYSSGCRVEDRYAFATSNGRLLLYADLAKARTNIAEKADFESHDLGPISHISYDAGRQMVWAISSFGLYGLNCENYELKKYGPRQGMQLSGLRWVEAANNGELWLGTVNGVFNYHPDKKNYPRYQFTEENGLSATECSLGLSAVAANGTIVFATSRGIDSFHPDSLVALNLPTRPIFTELQVNGKSWEGERTIYRTDTVLLEHDQNALNFTFADQEYADPLPAEFKMLLQVDGERIDTNDLGTNNFYNLANLSPAEYRLGLMARAASSADFSPPRWLTIIIKPHWSQTTWFHSLLILLGFLIVTGLISARYRYQLRVAEARAAKDRLAAQQREAALQRKIDLEEQRRKITSRMHNDMGGNLTTLSMLASRLGNTQNPEKTKELSDKIIHWTRDLRRRISSFLRMMNPQYDTLEQIFGILRAYAYDLLSEADIRLDIKTPAEYPTGSIAPDFGIALLEITQEVLTNIVKYAMANEVAMTMKIEGETVHVEIIDNGNGFAPTPEDFTRGIGLSSIKGLAQQHGGDLQYHANPGGGTQFQCWLIIERG